ncbi:MAG: type III pantothenate kinase [Steroidobacteraceae bacterium]
MRLLLDIGNTRIKWAVQTAQGLSAQQAVSHHGLSAVQLGTQVFAPCGQVSAVLVSNVAGEAVAEQVRQAARDCWQLEPMFITAAAQMSVQGRLLRNAYPQPLHLGTDRWLAMLAAYAMSASAVLVVSVGTAMTLDAVNMQGQHLGGLIVPGPELMTSSLLSHTSDIAARAAQTAVLDLSAASYFADNTRGCVQLGSLRATCGLIDAAYQHLHQLGEVQLLLTGGGATVLQSQLTADVQVIPDLVLRGLSHYG